MNHLLSLYDSAAMRRALLEAVLIGILCGIVGVHVIVRRLPFFAHTVAHAAFPGIVLALMVGAGALAGALGFIAVLIFGIWVTAWDRRLANSAIVGVALSGSLALGALLQGVQRTPRRDASAILVGQIAAVEPADLVKTAAVALVVLIALAALHKELVLSAFDQVEAAVQGRGRRVDLVALLAIGAAVVVTVPAVGTILASALLTVPAMTARLVTRKVVTAMAFSAAAGALAGVIGLTASAEWDLAAGASITLAATTLFAAVAAVRAVVALRRQVIVLPDAGSATEATF